MPRTKVRGICHLKPVVPTTLTTMQDETVRLRIELAYDGSNFHGWATQPGLPTIQEAVETSLYTIFRQAIQTTVAGRTDAGVHAEKQVLHCDVPAIRWNKLPGHHPTRTPQAALVAKLNGILGRQSGAIRILAADIAPKGFDARFSPLSRSYQYRIVQGNPNPLTRHFTYTYPKPLNIDLMRQEISEIQGIYDFGSFCKPRPGATTIRTIHEFNITATEQLLTVNLTADAFCHHMVRSLVGALLQVGDGTRTPGWLQKRLDTPVRDSHMAIAPAHGLILQAVHYPDDDKLAERAQQTRAKRESMNQTAD